MLRNSKTLRRRIPIPARSMNLTKKIVKINQVGGGEEDSPGMEGTTFSSKSPTAISTTTPMTTSTSTPMTTPMTTSTTTPKSILDNAMSVITESVNTANSLMRGDETAQSANQNDETAQSANQNDETAQSANQNDETTQSANQMGISPADETAEGDKNQQKDKNDESRKNLLSSGLQNIQEKYYQEYGVEKDDIQVSDGTEEMFKSGSKYLEIDENDVAVYTQDLPENERVAVVFGLTPGLKKGLVVYPDYSTIEYASTKEERHNARIVFDKLPIPFDAKPGFMVKVLVCYIVTDTAVTKGEPLRLPYIPLINITDYSTKESRTYTTNTSESNELQEENNMNSVTEDNDEMEEIDYSGSAEVPSAEEEIEEIDEISPTGSLSISVDEE